ncbi:MAG: cadherin-like beta sandwich domain-containing protein [Prevotella sp.]|jgi:hypothetical protein|nr:cadherin-like beta sandwich domain-containing protein [Prevotella sp.]
MKRINFIFALILLAGNSLFAQAWQWDIIDKSMGASWNEDEGLSTNKAWQQNHGGSAADVVTQTDNYLNIVKTVVGSTARYAWIRPAAALAELTANTAYTIEVKARAGEINKTTFPDNASNYEASQICLRIGTENLAAPIFLRYGDGTTGGSISTVNSGSNAYALNTSEWHVYRIVLQKDHAKYDVYIDDKEDPIFVNVAKGTTGDQRGVYFGAESQHRVNIDVEYVKMRTGDIYENSNARLSSLSVSAGTLAPKFNPAITEYTCGLLTGDPGTVTPSATAAVEGATISGDGAVDVSNGSGTSTITVTALDGTTTKTYTIHYVQTGNTDYSSLIVNNDFEYVAEGVLWNDNTNPNYPTFSDGSTTFNSNCFRPVKTNVTTIDTHAEFYGWQMSDWSYMFINADGTTPTQSIGIGGANTTHHGTASCWIAGTGSMRLSDDFEFYQTIDKDNISEGTYKVTCILGFQAAQHTSQRLFANQNVQFFGKESDYEQNKTQGEIYRYAGYVPEGEEVGKELKVYVTISENDPLKLGLRAGSYKGDGTLAATNNLPGWFKFDYFTLTKINPTVAANADLADITLDIADATLEAAESASLGATRSAASFSPATTEYDVELPIGTASVTATATAEIEDAEVVGDGTVDVSGGSAVQNIIVTALDGITTQTYTINYTVKSATGIDIVAADKLEKSTQYYTPTGIATPATAKGLLLKKITYTDGSTKVEKVMNR